MTKTNQTTFEKLSAINVNSKVEKKNNLTYLSWAWAWSEVKKTCPDATYLIGETEYDEYLGFMCHTSVTIDGETLGMWLPVMDGANKSMKKVSYKHKTKYGDKDVAAATTFDINKTIMRCLVKNLAMFGLGIYIYAGEDLPETETLVEQVSKKPSFVALKKDDANWVKVVSYINANKAQGVDKIMAALGTKYTITDALKVTLTKLIKSK
tara:strand:- start:21193 stop:21819 length:627 start_codon:yes stop_codon:yes gene_type:complete